MKSILSSILFFTFFTFHLSAQPLKDALRIVSILDTTVDTNSNRDSLYKILHKYFPEQGGNSTPSQVIGYFRNSGVNPFTAPLLSSVQAGGGAERSSLVPEKALSTLGTLDVTNFAFGMADFIVERTKTELNTAFFRRFQQEMNQEKYKNLRILFPETVQLLDVIGIEIYQFDHYLNSLRNAFARDLHSLAEHLPAVLDNLEADKVFAGSPELLPVLRLGLEMRLWISSDFQPGELLRLTAASEHLADLAAEGDNGVKALVNAIRFQAILSESFRNSNELPGYWVDWKLVEQLKDETTLRMYLGLLLEESRNPPYNAIMLPLPSNGSLGTLTAVLLEIGASWEPQKAKAEEYRNYILALSQQVKPVMHSVAAFRATQRDLQADKTTSQGEKRRRLFDNASDVYASFISLFDFVLDEKRMLPGIRISVPTEAKTIFNYFKTGSDICLHISHKEYAGAVAKVTGLLGEVHSLPESRTIADKKEQHEETTAIDVKKKLEKEMADLEDKIKEKKKAFAPLLKYGTFMANVVEAEDEEQVKKAIEAVALPPGSYTIKRESRFSVSLNAYLGGFVGNERIEEEVDNSGFNNWAITAPVGVTMSLGNVSRRSKHPASLSVFVPIIDVGTIASYRFKDRGDENAKLDQVSEIKLKNILAPGVFFELGIWGTPLTLGAGLQVGSRLRKVTGVQAETIGDYYIRNGLTLKIDIPIVHFAAAPGN